MLFECRFNWLEQSLSPCTPWCNWHTGCPKIACTLENVMQWPIYIQKESWISRGSPLCRLCKENSEDLEHILTSCNIYNEVRGRIIDEMEEICIESKSGVTSVKSEKTPDTLHNLSWIVVVWTCHQDLVHKIQICTKFSNSQEIFATTWRKPGLKNWKISKILILFCYFHPIHPVIIMVGRLK